MTSCLRAVRLVSAFFIMAGLWWKISTVFSNLTSKGDQSAEISSCLAIESSTAQLPGGGNQVAQNYVEKLVSEKVVCLVSALKFSFFRYNVFFLSFHNIMMNHVILLVSSISN